MSSQIIMIGTLVLSFINLIFIGWSIMKKKRNLALGLAFLQVILVYLSTI